MSNNIVIGIHSGKYISLATYLSAWRKLKAIPEDQRKDITFPNSLASWSPRTAHEILNEYAEGVQDRINLRAEGKCLISDYCKKGGQL